MYKKNIFFVPTFFLYFPSIIAGSAELPSMTFNDLSMTWDPRMCNNIPRSIPRPIKFMFIIRNTQNIFLKIFLGANTIVYEIYQVIEVIDRSLKVIDKWLIMWEIMIWSGSGSRWPKSMFYFSIVWYGWRLQVIRSGFWSHKMVFLWYDYSFWFKTGALRSPQLSIGNTEKKSRNKKTYFLYIRMICLYSWDRSPGLQYERIHRCVSFFTNERVF